ncbi:MAG TPA: phosphoribosyltransferase [Thermoplasmata archaeon]|nr:phosphoribosyltransferase [Thermoplasmata archaeon]
MDDFPRCRVATWEEIDRWADRLAEKIVAVGHRPQTIVGLTRGGWVPSRLLADRLGTKRLVALRAQHWGVTATPAGKAELTEGLSGDVRGEELLVADDITDTGESLELATQHLLGHHPKRVESATFLHITHSKFRPTYYAEEISRDAWVWVVFPWNYWEDLATLGRKALDSAGSVAAARRLLKEKTGWEPSLADLGRALEGAGSAVPPAAPP